MGHGVASGLECGNRTHTHVTHDHDTAVLPVPMIFPSNCHIQCLYMYALGCDTGMGRTVVLQSQVSQVQVRFQKSRPEATP